MTITHIFQPTVPTPVIPILPTLPTPKEGKVHIIYQTRLSIIVKPTFGLTLTFLKKSSVPGMIDKIS